MYGKYQKRNSGFTLVELMVTVAIMAVLAALAAPSFIGLIERWRVRGAVESLQSTLYYARSEAIKRGGGVVLQKSANGTDGCQQAAADQEWGCGWSVNASGAMLRVMPPPTKVNVTRKPSSSSMSFDRYGMAGSNSTSSFVLSPAGSGVSSPATTTLCMSAGGRFKTVSGEVECTD
ncbi:type IV fimbrial biogenesis protein FimT [Comamonas odontotermitis]|uniref:Type II secretion system protein H n=1 Tax=Comamonas odontotermitis TaxID=379895 RepID=A0ABR6RLY1_9BURK|nr:GspH/FimT family pseudopilin [Comamonas odontotermitis]MBB6580082.1 type IV fimbrial biogenesis protein FimT [Comamonas odontotermitis]